MEWKKVRAGILVALLATMALPSSAAARSVAPPGNSEADQYFETLPGSAGPRTPDPDRSIEDAVRESTVRPRTVRTLTRRGATGEVLAAAVAATGPAGAVAVPGEAPPSATSREPAASGRGGLGVAFPLGLAGMALAALAFVLSRRRGWG